VNVLEAARRAKLKSAASPPALRNYLGTQCAALLAMPNFMDVLPGMIFPDELWQPSGKRSASLAEDIQISVNPNN